MAASPGDVEAGLRGAMVGLRATAPARTAAAGDATAMELVGRFWPVAKASIPFVVSAALLVYLASVIDPADVAARIDARVVAILLPSLILFAVLTLAIEAATLLRVAPAGALTPWTAARIKAASYLAGLVHYTVGAGTVAVLLSRRAGLGLGDAVSVVILISLFDIGIVLLVGLAGLVWVSGVEVGLMAGAPALAAAAIAFIVFGFVLLRAPFSLGPFDALRGLAILRAPRRAPVRVLIELALLRSAIVACLVTLAWAALAAFEVRVPPADLIAAFAGVTLVSTLPIAFAGLGTGQAAFVFFFRPWAEDSTLLSCSLALSSGMILIRAATGLLFAREFTREALAAEREAKRALAAAPPVTPDP